jgi:hypothetical protein
MGVEQRWPAELLENGGDNSGIESGSPGGSPYSHTAVAQPLGQLRPAAGYDGLIEAAVLELSCQEPDLSLAAAPFSSGGDVNNRRRHVPGSMSAGSARVARRSGCCPLSRATSASSVRSSARLNGLWR